MILGGLVDLQKRLGGSGQRAVTRPPGSLQQSRCSPGGGGQVVKRLWMMVLPAISMAALAVVVVLVERYGSSHSPCSDEISGCVLCTLGMLVGQEV